MSIFKEMYERHAFETERDFKELQRMLSEAISRGHVEQVPVMKPNRFAPFETWYHDKETGEIYALDPPESPTRGSWRRVDPTDLMDSTQQIQ